MNYFIDKIEYYIPDKIIDNKYLFENCGIDPEFLEKKIGIKERRIARDNETVADMAYEAAKKLIEKNDIEISSIDALILCTQNPDYKLPTTACLLQDRLKLNKSCMAFDINLGCSGFVYTLVVAGSMMKSGIIKKPLIIMGDAYSKIIDYTDRNTASLFGDASCAILLGSCEYGYGILDSVFGTDGSGAYNLIAYNSGIAKNSEKSSFLYMNGREIFRFSIEVVPESVNKLLSKNNIKVTDIKYFIFHQANKYMLNEIQKKLGISDEQMIIDMEDYGNTVSSTIPIAYKNMVDRKAIVSGDLILFCGFGVGLSWGTVLYRSM